MTTTKTIVVIHTNEHDHVAYADLTDGTEAELKIVDTPGDTGKSLGDALNGETIVAFEGQCATPSDFDKVSIYDNTNGIVFESNGAITAAEFPMPNVQGKEMSVPIVKGYTIKALTTD